MAASQNYAGLYLVIQPAAGCQLGCPYCGQRHTSARLCPEHQDLVIERVTNRLRTGRFRRLEVGWFGAEPLVGLPEIRSLAPRLMALATEHGCQYISNITTNGLALRKEVATELVKNLGVSDFEITLDGTAEYHDLRRYTKGGSPTFELIFANTVALARREDLEVKVSIRCNVDRQNRDGVFPLLERLALEGLQTKVTFYAAPIYDWGNTAGMRSSPVEEYAAWEANLMVEMVRLGFKPGLLPRPRPITCMVFKPEAELVDPSGNLFNCTEVSLVPAYSRSVSQGNPLRVINNNYRHEPTNVYQIGDLNGAVYPEGRRKLGGFLDDVRSGKYLCHTCPMLPVCGGSCPKLWLEGQVPFPSAKFNIEQRMLLAYALTRLEEPEAPTEDPTL
ncbi:MAG: radical SAM protein [Isosphaeraceae bacterium]